jgi:hypothetical protein
MDKKQKQKILDELGCITRECQKQLSRAQKLLLELSQVKSKTSETAAPKEPDLTFFHVDKYPSKEEIVEGIFDGKDMISKEGMPYPIPENYASKSKLVEGDLLKLTITREGRFIYKQIRPVERESLRGIIQYHTEEDRFTALTRDGREHVLLKASVTYFKGEVGDHAIILVPKGIHSNWAALEAIVKEGDAVGDAAHTAAPVSEAGELEEI